MNAICNHGEHESRGKREEEENDRYFPHELHSCSSSSSNIVHHYHYHHHQQQQLQVQVQLQTAALIPLGRDLSARKDQEVLSTASRQVLLE